MALTAGSEGAALSDAEIAETLRVIGAAADPMKVLVAAIAKDSVRGTLAVAHEAAEAGFDAVLVTAPSAVGAANGRRGDAILPCGGGSVSAAVMLGSESGSQGNRLSVDEIAELALHGNVLGLYDDGLTVERYRAIATATESVKREVTVTSVFTPVPRRALRGKKDESGLVSAASLAGGDGCGGGSGSAGAEARTKTVGFQVMAAGSAAGMVELLEAGAAGAMLALSASAPQGCYEAYARFKDGDSALAAEKGERLGEGRCCNSSAGYCAVKYGCDCNGYYGGAPRLPALTARCGGACGGGEGVGGDSELGADTHG